MKPLRPAALRVIGGLFAAFAVVMGLAHSTVGIVIGCLGLTMSVVVELIQSRGVVSERRGSRKRPL